MQANAANFNFTSGGAAMRSARPALAAEARRDKEAGFTLLELLVVLAILGLLVGLVAPAALRQLGSAKEKIAHQSIERLGSVLDMYKLDVGAYPTTEQGLQGLITRPARHRPLERTVFERRQAARGPLGSSVCLSQPKPAARA